MRGRVKIERSSGNVFTDLGFPKAEAENLMLRSELMSESREMARGMTQAKAAKRFGITQPRLNDLLLGKIDKFSLDALLQHQSGELRGGELEEKVGREALAVKT
jgi:predicted XRE-type DNA-binding protein